MSECVSHFHSRHVVRDVDGGLHLMLIWAIKGFEIGRYVWNHQKNDDEWHPVLLIKKNVNESFRYDLHLYNRFGNVCEMHRGDFTKDDDVQKIRAGFQQVIDAHDRRHLVFRSF